MHMHIAAHTHTKETHAHFSNNRHMHMFYTYSLIYLGGTNMMNTGMTVTIINDCVSLDPRFLMA